jgi:predicted transcriptional regulator YdeE
MTETWKEIWESDLTRTFETDFEVYGQRSQNWEDAVVDIFLSVQE